MRGVPRVRPNYFVSLRIDDPSVVSRLVSLQQLLVAGGAIRADCIVPHKFHITLCVLHLRDDDGGADVRRALDALRTLDQSFPVFRMSLRGVHQFGQGKVVFAQVADGLNELVNLAGLVRSTLPQDLVLEKDRTFQPHCTLWKSQRARVPPSAITSLPQEALMLGDSFNCGSIELVRMSGVDPNDGFYLAAQREFFMLHELPTEAERLALLEQIYHLESVSFPEDEAASKEGLERRIRNCPQLFLVALRDGKVYGFVNGTAASSETGLTHETMSRHDPSGDLCCIHGVVVDPALRRRGIAGRMLRYYTRAVSLSQFRLLCKPYLVPFYQKQAKFIDMGLSHVSHGKDQWQEMSFARNRQ